MNYVHPEHGTSSTFPYNLPGPGRGAMIGSIGNEVWTSAGITEIPALIRYDLRTSYVIPRGLFGMPDVVTTGTSVSLNIDNLLDEYPILVGTTSSGGGDIGRMITIGLRKRF
jgi:hypothetical protein